MTEQQERVARASAAFLLVIPGATAVGIGIGMMVGAVPGLTLAGIGVGMVLWGMIVALRPVIKT